MAEEKTNKTPEIIKAEKKASKLNLKILIFGLPIFIVQLVVVYFVTANILLSDTGKTVNHNGENQEIKNPPGDSEKKSGNTEKNKASENGASGFIYAVDDMIVNPAQTNGKMLLLASLGLAVENEEAKKTLEEKQVVVKDAIISVLSGKNVNQLGSTTYRDTIKTEILKNLSLQFPNSKINNIYFSKFIIQ